MTKIDIFKLKIQRNFLNSKNKNNLFASLREQLRKFLKYPADYIMLFLETIAEPLPLHAAVSAEYFRQHGCLCDEITGFLSNLKTKCEENFITEIKSSDSDLNKCADLHTTFSYLKPENIGISISEAVEKLSDSQREALFSEVGNCISAVHDISQEERDVLDPILKYFSAYYSEEINKDFLENNRERFSELMPNYSVLSQLLTNAVKNKHFYYFRILYELFPNWVNDQKDITSDEFIDLSFNYANQENDKDNLLELLIEPSMKLAYNGHTYLKKENLEKWYERINKNSENYPFRSYIEPDICYAYYCHNIAECGIIRESVEKMPFFKQNTLHYYYEGTDIKILQEDASLLKIYLDKTGEGNPFYFNSKYICPDVEPICGFDYEKLIQNLGKKHSAKEMLYFYFNTSLRKVVPPWQFYEILKYDIPEEDFDEALDDYVFAVEIDKGKIITSQFCSDVDELRFFREDIMEAISYYSGMSLGYVHIKLKSLNLFPIPVNLINCDDSEISEISLKFSNAIYIEIVKLPEEEEEEEEDYNIWIDNAVRESFNYEISYILEFPEKYQKLIGCTDEQMKKIMAMAENPQYNDNLSKFQWYMQSVLNPKIAICYGMTAPCNTVVDIQETACLSAEIQKKDVISFKISSVFGTVKEKDSETFEFIPDEDKLLCKKAPIILENSDYIKTFYESYIKNNIPFIALINKYDKTKNVFYCISISAPEFIAIANHIKKELSDIAVEKQSVGLCSMSLKFYPKLFLLKSYLDTIENTVIKALKNEKFEDVLLYLNNIEEENILHDGKDIYTFRLTEYYELYAISDISKHIKQLVKTVPTEIISKVFKDTPLRLKFSLNKWCKLLFKYEKLNDFINSLNDFEFIVYRDSDEDFLKSIYQESVLNEFNKIEDSEHKSMWQELYTYGINTQNALINKVCVDGEDRLNPAPDGYTRYRIIGYDAESDTVILTKITGE